jgi:hypothetical protein
LRYSDMTVPVSAPEYPKPILTHQEIHDLSSFSLS